MALRTLVTVRFVGSFRAIAAALPPIDPDPAPLVGVDDFMPVLVDMVAADFINDDKTVISDKELPCTGSFEFEAVRMFGPLLTVVEPLLTIFVPLKAATLVADWLGAVCVNVGTLVRISFVCVSWYLCCFVCLSIFGTLNVLPGCLVFLLFFYRFAALLVCFSSRNGGRFFFFYFITFQIGSAFINCQR